MAAHIHAIRTRYPHWGKHSGFHRFLDRIDATKYSLTVQNVSDNDDDFPLRNAWITARLSGVLQTGDMEWYKLSDLTAEIRALGTVLRQRPQILHYLDGEHSARFLPRLLRAGPGARPRLVATYHQPPRFLGTLADRRVLDALDTITVVSPDQADYFRQFVDPEKVRLLLHGIDTDYFEPTQRHGTGEPFCCLTVGHYLRDFQTLRRVAEALQPCTDIAFRVVSPHSAQLDGLSNVYCCEDLEDDALLECYQQADLLFLPLTDSSANNALLEGMACGLPLVSTLLPSVEAYASPDAALLVEAASVRGYVEAIRTLRDDPARRARMGLAARARAEELDWRKVVPRYEAVYDDVMKNLRG